MSDKLQPLTWSNRLILGWSCNRFFSINAASWVRNELSGCSLSVSIVVINSIFNHIPILCNHINFIYIDDHIYISSKFLARTAGKEIIFSDVAFHADIFLNLIQIFIYSYYKIIIANNKMHELIIIYYIKFDAVIKTTIIEWQSLLCKIDRSQLRSLVVILNAFRCVRASFAKRPWISNVSQFRAALFFCCRNVMKCPSCAINIESVIQSAAVAVF